MAANLALEQLSSLANWSAYGQPGAPSANRVTRAGLNAPLPFQSPITSPWHVRLQPGQLEKLMNGFQPQEMEDKGFVYAEGPSAEGELVVKFYRSWTGSLIAEMIVQLSKAEDGRGKDENGMGVARVTAIVWEQSEDVVNSQNEERAKEGVRGVCRWVLGLELQEDEA